MKISKEDGVALKGLETAWEAIEDYPLIAPVKLMKEEDMIFPDIIKGE